MVPAGTPPEITALLHRELAAVVALPEVNERLSSLGFNPVANTPAEFANQIKFNTEKWRKVIEAADIKLE
jgi:tripartite-type tricarboxylate transporter receptor subunit TctC